MSANREDVAYYSNALDLAKKETKQILNSRHIYSKYIKRILDVFFSIVGIIALSPVFLIIAILIKTGSKGKVFFKEQFVSNL